MQPHTGPNGDGTWIVLGIILFAAIAVLGKKKPPPTITIIRPVSGVLFRPAPKKSGTGLVMLIAVVILAWIFAVHG